MVLEYYETALSEQLQQKNLSFENVNLGKNYEVETKQPD